MVLPRHHRQGTLALAFALALGCAPAASQQDFGFGGPTEERATVAVDNQYFGEMIIYILNGGSRTRLGTVTALSTASLNVPRELIGANVQLYASTLAPGAGFTSHQVMIAPGSTVSLRLANDPALSDVRVF